MTRAVALLTPARDEVIPALITTGPQATIAHLLGLLGTVRGTWPEDRAAGLPYLSPGFGRDLVVLEALVASQVRRAVGVLDVVSVQASRVGDGVRVAVVVDVASGAAERARVALAAEIDPGVPGAWYVLSTGARPISGLT